MTTVHHTLPEYKIAAQGSISISKKEIKARYPWRSYGGCCGRRWPLGAGLGPARARLTRSSCCTFDRHPTRVLAMGAATAEVVSVSVSRRVIAGRPGTRWPVLGPVEQLDEGPPHRHHRRHPLRAASQHANPPPSRQVRQHQQSSGVGKGEAGRSRAGQGGGGTGGTDRAGGTR